MQKVYYQLRNGRWFLADEGIEFVVQTKEPITVEGYTSLLATALALAHDKRATETS